MCVRNTQGSAQEDSRRHVRASTKQRWTPSVFLTGHGNNFKEKKGRSREWLCADGGDTGVLPRDVRCDLWSEDKEPQEEIDHKKGPGWALRGVAWTGRGPPSINSSPRWAACQASQGQRRADGRASHARAPRPVPCQRQPGRGLGPSLARGVRRVGFSFSTL